jgi:hypothetical protein
VVGTGVLWDVSTLCAVVPPPGLYGVVGTGLLWDVSTLCTPSWTIWGGGHRAVVGCQYTVYCSTSFWTIWGVVSSAWALLLLGLSSRWACSRQGSES